MNFDDIPMKFNIGDKFDFFCEFGNSKSQEIREVVDTNKWGIALSREEQDPVFIPFDQMIFFLDNAFKFTNNLSCSYTLTEKSKIDPTILVISAENNRWCVGTVCPQEIVATIPVPESQRLLGLSEQIEADKNPWRGMSAVLLKMFGDDECVLNHTRINEPAPGTNLDYELNGDPTPKTMTKIRKLFYASINSSLSPQCECGAAKAKSSIHSTWCPVK